MTAAGKFAKTLVGDNFLDQVERQKRRVAGLEARLTQDANLVSADQVANFDPTNVLLRIYDPTSGALRLILSGVNLLDEYGLNANLAGLDDSGNGQFYWSATDGSGVCAGGAIKLTANGIEAAILGDVIIQTADNGDTYRRGRLGMDVLEGETIPNFGIQVQDDTVSSELVINGDFASGDFTSWTIASGTGWEVRSSATGFTHPEAYSDRAGEINQAVDISPGTYYRLSAKGMTGGAGTAFHIGLDFYSAAGGGGSLVSSVTNALNWPGSSPVSSRAYGFKCASGVASVKIRIICPSSVQDFYVDNVSLVATPLSLKLLLTSVGVKAVENGIVSRLNRHGWNALAVPDTTTTQSDEFDDASLDTTLWTEFDPANVMTPSEDATGAILTCTSAAGDKIAGLRQDIPAGNFTITTRVAINEDAANTAWVKAGLALWEDATNATKKMSILALARNTNTPSVRYDQYTNYSSYSSNPLGSGTLGLLDQQRGIYLRIRRNSTSYYFELSADGVAWRALPFAASAAQALGYTPTHFGICAFNNAGTQSIRALFSHFRYQASDVGVNGVPTGNRG